MPHLIRANAEIKVSFEFLRLFLDLPPEYRIMGVLPQSSEDFAADVFSIAVCADHLPDLCSVSARPHLLTLTYRRVRAGDVELDTVNVIPSAERE